MFRHRSFVQVGWQTACLVLICLMFFARPQFVAAQSADPTASQAGKPFRTYLPLGSGNPVAPSSVFPVAWLARINAYRGLAQLAPLTENSEWSDGCAKHARYIVKNDVLDHSENAGNPWYTVEGATAAKSSNLIAGSALTVSDQWAIDTWMVAPFHALGILDPHLQSTGFGSYRESGPGYRMAAVVDIMRGRAMQLATGTRFPLMWPGDGATVPLRMLIWAETPSPLSACPGYQLPTGLPIVVQMGDGSKMPSVTAYSIVKTAEPGQPLESCMFTESTYRNADGSLQDLGRALLNPRDAIVLIPRAALTANTSYTVSLTVDGKSYTWTFKVGDIH